MKEAKLLEKFAVLEKAITDLNIVVSWMSEEVSIYKIIAVSVSELIDKVPFLRPYFKSIVNKNFKILHNVSKTESDKNKVSKSKKLLN